MPGGFEALVCVVDCERLLQVQQCMVEARPAEPLLSNLEVLGGVPIRGCKNPNIMV